MCETGNTFLGGTAGLYTMDKVRFKPGSTSPSPNGRETNHVRTPTFFLSLDLRLPRPTTSSTEGLSSSTTEVWEVPDLSKPSQFIPRFSVLWYDGQRCISQGTKTFPYSRCYVVSTVLPYGTNRTVLGEDVHSRKAFTVNLDQINPPPPNPARWAVVNCGQQMPSTGLQHALSARYPWKHSRGQIWSKPRKSNAYP